MIPLLLLAACASPPDSGETGGASETGDSGETAHSGETGETGDSAETGDSGDGTDPGRLSLDVATNYTYTSALDVDVLPAAAAQDATIDWSGLTTDLAGRAFNPATDVAQLGLAWIPALDYDAIEAALVSGTLLQEDVAAVYTLPPAGRTAAKLSEFVTMGDPLVPAASFLDGSGAWLGIVTPKGRSGVAMLHFFEPRAEAPPTDLTFTSASATLTFAASLGPALPAPATGPWSADWSGLDVGAGGAPLGSTPVDLVWIGRFDGRDAATLEAEFVRAEQLSAASWTAPVSGADHLDDLAEARDATGGAFPGFDAGSTWVVALRCTSCANPAPPYAAVVEVVP